MECNAYITEMLNTSVLLRSLIVFDRITSGVVAYDEHTKVY